MKNTKTINNYKKCSKCKQIKSQDNFYGSDIYCKECRKFTTKEWQIKNYKKYSEKRKKNYRKKHPVIKYNKYETGLFIKFCTSCKKWKLKIKFYKDKQRKDGLTYHCKDCRKKYYQEHREHYKKYNKEYSKKRNRGKNYYQEVIKPWTDKNKEKKQASKKLRYHIKNGNVNRLPYCQICGEFNNKISGHHFDYTKPLQVIWCCPSCHRLIHLNKLDHLNDITLIKSKLKKEVAYAETVSSLS